MNKRLTKKQKAMVKAIVANNLHCKYPVYPTRRGIPSTCGKLSQWMYVLEDEDRLATLCACKIHAPLLKQLDGELDTLSEGNIVRIYIDPETQVVVLKTLDKETGI